MRISALRAEGRNPSLDDLIVPSLATDIANQLGCDAGSLEGPQSYEELEGPLTTTGYLPSRNYCGPGVGKQNLNTGLCLNKACFDHDRCYEECNLPKSCYFSSPALACDSALQQGCHQCLKGGMCGFRCKVVCVTVTVLKHASSVSGDLLCKSEKEACKEWNSPCGECKVTNAMTDMLVAGCKATYANSCSGYDKWCNYNCLVKNDGAIGACKLGLAEYCNLECYGACIMCCKGCGCGGGN